MDTRQVTTLSNGVRIITETRASVGCSMAIFLHTGSRFETEETHGSTHFLQHLAYKVNLPLSSFHANHRMSHRGPPAMCPTGARQSDMSRRRPHAPPPP